ncbi:hypothetical protein, partial [Rhodococcus sp. 1139]|uniref:hypothetical protein n=1 Tax=Rhodococcus sp. 1139 TaxID=1833762 RepID=UPI001C4078EC
MLGLAVVVFVSARSRLRDAVRLWSNRRRERRNAGRRIRFRRAGLAGVNSPDARMKQSSQRRHGRLGDGLVLLPGAAA